MPTAHNLPGIFKIVDKTTGCCYVGKSKQIGKRVKDHFRLLRWGNHTNKNLQKAYDQYGPDNFDWQVEATCEDLHDLGVIENAFLSGDAQFIGQKLFSVSDPSKPPMLDRRHSNEVRNRIKFGRKLTNFDYKAPEYRNALVATQTRKWFSNPVFVAKVRFIVENPDMSYAERGRALGVDTSSVRKLALKYAHLKGKL